MKGFFAWIVASVIVICKIAWFIVLVFTGIWLGFQLLKLIGITVLKFTEVLSNSNLGGK